MVLKINADFIWKLAVAALMLIVFGAILAGASKPLDNSQASITKSVSKVDLNGKQVLDIKAKGGYTPAIITAKANTPTALKITTNNTYDCSLAFMIPELKVSTTLPTTGETYFDLGSQPAGKEIKAACSMWMYTFVVRFV